MMAMILSLFLAAWILSVAALYQSDGEGVFHLDQPINLNFKSGKHWAQYSPYHAVGRYRGPPLRCEVTQVLVYLALAVIWADCMAILKVNIVCFDISYWFMRREYEPLLSYKDTAHDFRRRQYP